MFKKSKKKTPLGRVGRVEREQRYRKIVQITTITVVSLVVVVTIVGLVINSLIVPSRPIVTVNGQEILTKDFQRRVQLDRDRLVNEYNLYQNFALSIQDPTQQQQYLSYLSQIEAQLEPAVIGESVMNQMIDEIFIQEEAASRGIEVNQQEVDDYFNSLFGYYPDGYPTPTPTSEILPTSTLSETQLALITPTPLSEPTESPDDVEDTGDDPTEEPVEAPPEESTAAPTDIPLPTSVSQEEYQTSKSEYLDRIKDYDVDENFVRNLVHIQLLREKLNADIAEGINPEEEQVWARHILLENEDTAQDLLDQLDEGADFGDLAREFSTGPSGPSGGDLGWFAQGQMVEPFEEAAFAAEVGEIVGPVETQFGFHIIQILGREMRPVDQATLDQFVFTVLSDLLNEYKTDAEIEFAENWIRHTPTEPSVISVLQSQPQTQP
jgi:parvulin-like peptidyl-prolyl isomerase